MNTVRVGIIGMGMIGRHHAEYLLGGKVSHCQLAAIASASKEKRDEFASRGVTTFATAEEMFRSREVDAVLIATPHFQHPALGIAAFEAGLHVICEKPIAAQKADAEKFVAVAGRFPKQKFGAMFQMRVEPRYAKIRELLRSRELGDIVRMNWIVTDWFRTEAYYASGGWRATWRGEGGGVLLNQCLHNFDMLAWLLGMPARVRGFCRFGRFHNIEVEDEATCYMEFPNGATGVFVTSTGEAPGTNRLEIAGTRGRLVLENERLTFTRNKTDMIEFSKTATHSFAKPDAEIVEIPFANLAVPHSAVMQNFVNAVLDDEPLIAPGAEGIHSVELANAIIFSSLQNETIDLPLDGVAWEARLNALAAESESGEFRK